MHFKSKNPPIIARTLLRKFLPVQDQDYLMGDFEESYKVILSENNIVIAWLWYWRQVFISLASFSGYSIVRSLSMLKNYFKSAFRNLKKYKLYSTINIIGLAVGIASCIFSYNFIRFEFSFDKFHEDADKMYYVKNEWVNYGSSSSIEDKVFNNVAENFNEIYDFVIPRYSTLYIKVHNQITKESIIRTTPNFFTFFSFPLIYGDEDNILNEPNSVVLSEEKSIHFFGEINSVGKTLSIFEEGKYKDYMVTAIAKNAPANSSIKFGILIKFVSTESYSFPIVKINSRKDAINLESILYINKKDHFSEFMLKDEELFGRNYKIRFFPLLNDHLKLNTNDFTISNSVLIKSYILVGLSLIVLLIASFNYIILYTGNLSFRFKEMGIRKVIGAKKNQLYYQLLIDSSILSFTAIIFGLGLYHVSFPFINNFMELKMESNMLIDGNLFTYLLFVFFAINTIVTIYPSFIISKINSTTIFDSNIRIGNNNILTKTLMIFQFSFTIILLISTVVMSSQKNFYLNKDLGFTPNNLVVIPFLNIKSEKQLTFNKKIDQFKNNIMKISGIESSAASNMQLTNSNIWKMGYKNQDTGKRHFFGMPTVSYDFFDTYNIKFIKGINFDKNNLLANSTSVIINEKFVDEYKIINPIGKMLSEVTSKDFMYNREDKKINGVIENTIIEKITNEIISTMYLPPTKYSFDNIVIKLSKIDQQNQIKMINSEFSILFPDQPFTYSFVEDNINSQYVDENRWENIIKYTSFLAILISCSGLFALSLLTVINRLKEIGIRKILGSSRYSILSLLNREFVVLITIANVIAWPIAYYAMDNWLESFVYKIELDIKYFITSGLVAVLIAFVTVSYHSFKAANSNPVNILKNE